MGQRVSLVAHPVRLGIRSCKMKEGTIENMRRTFLQFGSLCDSRNFLCDFIGISIIQQPSWVKEFAEDLTSFYFVSVSSNSCWPSTCILHVLER